MPPAPSNCGWFMVPPGLTAQVAHAFEFNFSPDIATPAHLCGQAASNARQQGLQEFGSAKEAQAASDAANTAASPALQSGPNFGLADIGRFFAKLGKRETWIRVVEVTVGGGLILVALAHITGVGNKTPVGRVLKITKGSK
jgi:hypothetical protein